MGQTPRPRQGEVPPVNEKTTNSACNSIMYMYRIDTPL